MKKKEYTSQGAGKATRLPRHFMPGHTAIPRDDHYQVRKVGLTGDRVKTDPHYHNTRLAGQQFAHAATLATRFYELLCWPLGIHAGRSKLQGIIMKAIHQQEEHAAAARQLLPDALFELVNRDYNEEAPFEEVCSLMCTWSHANTDDRYELCLPSFVPQIYFAPPLGAKGARVYLMVFSLNLKRFTCALDVAKTSYFPIKKMHVPACSLSVDIDACPGDVQLIALGIQWYSDGENGEGLTPAAIPGSLRVVDINFLSNDSFL